MREKRALRNLRIEQEEMLQRMKLSFLVKSILLQKKRRRKKSSQELQQDKERKPTAHQATQVSS